ncbi:MAG TPA: helicase C-terminal domain-containing protein [Ktedonobacterales bacterium]
MADQTKRTRQRKSAGSDLAEPVTPATAIETPPQDLARTREVPPADRTRARKAPGAEPPAEIPPREPWDEVPDAPPGEPWDDAPEAPPEPMLSEVVEADLRQGGVLSRALDGYDERPAQVAMARLVADALEAGDHAAIEAGTGTGKSLAYLLPIIRSGKVALVSTANKALQEQLYYKDIPFIQRHIRDFKAALVKGMANYLCLDRLEEERTFQGLVHERAFERMLEIANGDEWDGDLDLLPTSLSPATRGRVAADGDQCAWSKCPFFGDCYVRKMRERAHDAQVIVVNHTLLLLDAAMDGWLLPERDVVVLDEAHHLEEEATRAFTITVTPGRVQSLLAQHRLREHADADKQQEATDANVRCWDAVNRRINATWRTKQPLAEPLEEGLRLATAIDDVAASLVRNAPREQDDRDTQLYEKLTKRARSLAADLRAVFGVPDPEGTVYYVDPGGDAESAEPDGLTSAGGRGPRRGIPRPSVSAAPLAVSELLGERLFTRVPVIATSATLAIGGDFGFFRARVGLPEAQERVLPLAFDFASHAVLYVPRLRHEPAFGDGSGAYLEELGNQMVDLVTASGGRAFLLFSSQRALRAVHAQIGATLTEALDCAVLVQGGGASRAELVRQFRTEPRPVLFGLKSFWEGVDITGEALSLVVIDKLPFVPPDDPIQEKRVAHMKAAGENWFGGYTLPLAILQLKQGVGRLLRTRDDRGVMAILDTRIHTKSYGRQVLTALPPARRSANIADVRDFFAT